MNLTTIIKSPIVTEKALLGQDKGQYHFFVDVSANKNQIKQAFVQLFSKTPVRINVIKVKASTKTDWKTRKIIKTKNLKKAIITLKKGDKIEILKSKSNK